MCGNILHLINDFCDGHKTYQNKQWKDKPNLSLNINIKHKNWNKSQEFINKSMKCANKSANKFLL
jgi:hypothetical protein